MVMKTSRKKYWQTLVELIRFYTGCSCVGIRILDTDKNIPYEEYIGFTKEFWESENWISLNYDQCICTRVFGGNWLSQDLDYITENGSFCCNDTNSLDKSLTDEQKCNLRGTCIETGYRTVAVIPIRHEGKVLGAIHIADKSTDRLPYKTVSFIEAMSAYMGEALHNFAFNKRLCKAEQDILLNNIVNQVTIDSMQGIVMLTNQHCEVLTVNSLGEKYGLNENKKCFSTFGNNQQCPWCKLTEALKTRKPQRSEVELNGLIYEITWIPISSELCLNIAVDITDRKMVEKEMAKLDRLNLVGEMSASIGHEIRNPLTAVKGFLQMLSGRENNAANKEYYDIMLEELERATSTITEFLSLAKNRMVNFEPVSLNKIIDGLLDILDADALKQKKRIVFNKGKVPKIYADTREIRQLIRNLGLNGLEAMDAGGLLTISTYSENNEVVLSVKDEGKGIQPELLEELGNPFVTTKANGTGLGLAICYSVANQHNANIDFTTSREGTTFYVRFEI